jgi:superfamily II DNA or RNA helicase
VDLAHAAKLCEQFNAAGIPAEYMDGDTEGEERDAIGERLRLGVIKVVCNCGVATTGVDWPWVSYLAMCRPTQSPSLWVQICGRALRKHPQGGDTLIADHTRTAKEIGLPDEIHYESLDDGAPEKSGKSKKRKKPATPKECPSCQNVKPAGVHKCPHCGFAPQRQSDLEFAAGELVEATRGPEDLDGTPQAERQRWYAMLVWEASKRGYKPGWVNHRYAAKFGYPPGRDIDRGCRPIAPDQTCRNWIRSQHIAYAKGKAKAAAEGRAA